MQMVMVVRNGRFDLATPGILASHPKQLRADDLRVYFRSSSAYKSFQWCCEWIVWVPLRQHLPVMWVNALPLVLILVTIDLFRPAYPHMGTFQQITLTRFEISAPDLLRNDRTAIVHHALSRKLNSRGNIRGATNAIHFLEKLYPHMFCMAFSLKKVSK